MMTKPKFLKSVGKMSAAEKIELLVELKEMARWLSDDYPDNGKRGSPTRYVPCQFDKWRPRRRD